jgi:hypothetical protein
MKSRSNFKDGILGLCDSVIRCIPALLTLAAVLMVFAGLWWVWTSFTVVSIQNDSAAELRDVVLSHRPYEGEEQVLWRLSLRPKQSIMRLSTECCWRLVVRHQANETSCRYPSFAPATFVVVAHEDGTLACGGYHRTLLP